MIKHRSSYFCKNLACIAIDEGHLIWGWREFCKEYHMIRHIKDIFPQVPMMVLSATITPSVLEYIHVLLKLESPSFLYWRLLDRLNLTYVVAQITKPNYDELEFLVPKHGSIMFIPKTMIFVDNIDHAVFIATYLRKQLLVCFCRTSIKVVIRTLTANLTPSTKSTFLINFQQGNTRIWVCTECAGIGIDICNVACVIQWKIHEHLTLAALMQQLGCGRRDLLIPIMTLVFVENKYVLATNVHTLGDSNFKNN